MRLIQLSEVVVTAKSAEAKRIEKRDEIRLLNPFNSASDYTVYREEFENRHTSIPQILAAMPGVSIKGI